MIQGGKYLRTRAAARAPYGRSRRCCQAPRRIGRANCFTASCTSAIATFLASSLFFSPKHRCRIAETASSGARVLCFDDQSATSLQPVCNARFNFLRFDSRIAAGCYQTLFCNSGCRSSKYSPGVWIVTRPFDHRSSCRRQDQYVSTLLHLSSGRNFETFRIPSLLSCGNRMIPSRSCGLGSVPP